MAFSYPDTRNRHQMYLLSFEYLRRRLRIDLRYISRKKDKYPGADIYLGAEQRRHALFLVLFEILRGQSRHDDEESEFWTFEDVKKDSEIFEARSRWERKFESANAFWALGDQRSRHCVKHLNPLDIWRSWLGCWDIWGDGHKLRSKQKTHVTTGDRILGIQRQLVVPSGF